MNRDVEMGGGSGTDKQGSIQTIKETIQYSKRRKKDDRSRR